MHLRDPVTQAVLDEPAHDRLVGVERVAAAGVVGVTRLVFLQDVVEVVGQAAVANGRPLRSALRRVVVDHVEDHFDARAVEGLHHVAELVPYREGVLSGAVGMMRREERDRLVPPVVHATARRILRIELEDGQQLHGGDAEVLEVGDLLDQPGIRAALPGRHPGAFVAGEAAHVELVDHGLGERALERLVPFPVVAAAVGGRHHALHGRGRVVAGTAGGLAVVTFGHRHRQAVGVEQQLLPVEPQATLRREGAVRAVAVDLSRAQPRDERVPVVVGAMRVRIERDDPRRPPRAGLVEQQQLQPGGALREDAEVHALGPEGRAQRSARPFADRRRAHGRRS